MSLQREDWGPKFWFILHTLAECSGTITHPILANDEADNWTMLLKAQAFVMPCALCKQHYLEWRNKHPLPNLRLLKGLERKSILTLWLWNCHNSVNQQNQKEVFSQELLQTTYTRKSIKQVIQELSLMLKNALERSLLKSEDIKRWKTTLIHLQMLYGL